jgi:CBS domain-containing protein
VSTTAVQPYRFDYLMPPFEHATVADAMHPGIISVAPDTSVIEVARIMSAHRVHCVVVLGLSQDRSGESLVWGIVTDWDLIERGIGADAGATAGELANTPVLSVKPAMPLADARELMLSNDLTHVIVIHPVTLRPFAVLSTLDLAAVLGWGED